MNRAEYHLLDVFTDTPFAGNQLAVFPAADGLDTATCQAIARELNLAETVFLGSARAANHYPMRIFTPTEELDFAGHPTVGTAWLLAELGMVTRDTPLILEPPVGELPIAFADGKVSFITARPARIHPSTLDASSAAALLGLEAHQVVGAPVVACCGLAFHLIEVDDPATLAQIRLSAVDWARLVTPSGVEQVYLYSVESASDTETVLRARMFCREHGLCEDAATGSAAAALTGYLACRSEMRHCIIHQGVEMGRPSVIETAMAGELIRVGGRAVRVGKGEIYVE
ncbi:PhzF family phenazine biosynthesis protein [Halomonas sp. PAMB 3232]|uniref:PhzF family phenazine biosynthesis protein n=1 Tax=Halomonas sp. PAMB 3232 TaxID=3075221 RepID=UPI00289C4B23|nr:PhzF family phenazine biosynthesis protein [Halomonas sp. PAMB 3232]WNL38612.1 PhzF family phenazine biosynthesis protein [Halomonas sp. PAMB 3232]